jgi:hypothetical protein
VFVIAHRSFGFQFYWRYQINPRHIAMGLKARVAIVPSDGDVFPVRCFDCPMIRRFAVKTNASAQPLAF